jgi:hypothetical protein
MTYHVYENWTVEGRPRATIHRSACSFCNNGKGIHPGASAAHGAWHGPFASLHEAEDTATRKGNGNVRHCKFCHPTVA